MIETKRLQIIPLPQEQLSLYIKADPLLEKQLNIQPFTRSFSRDLLEAFEHIILPRVADVKNKYEFFTLWIILLREERIAVGDLFFKGNPDELGAIEIGYGIFEGFRSRGYMTETGAQPVAAADRIKSIDSIRGFALLGILLMNIPGFGMNMDYWYYILSAPRSGYDYYTFAAVEIFFDGTMRGLFSMLFGAGMVLFMMNKKEVPGKPSVAVYYYRRLLWLVFFGVINAFVILWFGDILFFYGLFGMVLFAFRKLPAKWLLIISLAIVCCGMIQQGWRWSETREKRANYLAAITAKNEKKKLTDEQQAAIGIWTQVEKSQKPDTAQSNLNLRTMQAGSYGKIFSYWIPRNASDEVSGTYYGIWDMLAMMFLGMTLFAWGFFTNKLQTSTYVMWLLIGYGIGIPVGYQLCNIDFNSFGHVGAFVDRWRSNPFTYSEFRRIPITIGHASLLMLLYRSGFANWLMKALAAVGQMAFTNYLMQSIICTLFFYGYGLAYYGKLHLHQIYYVVAAVWIFQILFSLVWLKYFRFGPFEWVWRSLTYWKKQPMKL